MRDVVAHREGQVKKRNAEQLRGDAWTRGAKQRHGTVTLCGVPRGEGKVMLFHA